MQIEKLEELNCFIACVRSTDDNQLIAQRHLEQKLKILVSKRDIKTRTDLQKEL